MSSTYSVVGQTGSANAITINNTNGNVGIGTTAPAYPLDVSGNMHSSGNVYTGTSGVVYSYTGTEVMFMNSAFATNNTTAAANFGLYQSSSGYTVLNCSPTNMIGFNVGNVNKMMLNSSGQLGIGTSTPTSQLHLAGGPFRLGTLYEQLGTYYPENIQWGNIGTLGYAAIQAGMNSTGGGAGAGGMLNIFTKIGNSASYGGVSLNNGSTSWSANSDERCKNNIRPLTECLSNLMTIQPVPFCVNNDDTHTRHVGVLAQDVVKVLPEAVNVPGDSNEMMSVRYTELIPLLFGAIQDLKAEVEKLKSKD